MAAPQCMSNDGNPAIFIGTFYPSGDSVSLCNDCMPAWCSAVVSGMLGIDPDLFGVAVAAMEKDAEAAEHNDPAETGAPPAMVDPTPAGADAPAAQNGTRGAPVAADGGGHDGAPPDEHPDPGAAGE